MRATAYCGLTEELTEQNFFLPLCDKHGLLGEPDESAVTRALLSEPPPPPRQPDAAAADDNLEVTVEIVHASPDFGICDDDVEALATNPHAAPNRPPTIHTEVHTLSLAPADGPAAASAEAGTQTAPTVNHYDWL